jgi:hypothetical protein
LPGDSKTSFFHKKANGIKGRVGFSLKDGTRGIVEGEALKQHITYFYKRDGEHSYSRGFMEVGGGYLKWRMTL